MRKLTGQDVVLATHNPGKLKEFQNALAADGVKFILAGALGLPEPEETGATFAENALLKATAAANASGLPALADDSGLAVRALGGAPGIYSARWAGPEKNFNVAFDRIERELEAAGSADRAAAFVCVLAVAWPDGRTETAEGQVTGSLVKTPRGKNGFGYDPIFIPEGDNRTFAEMERDEKGAFSHRMRAIERLREALA